MTEKTPVSDLSLEELIARAIEAARTKRDEADPQDKRELALVVTHLETSALWLCQYKALGHLGDDALLDWLREIA